MELQFHSFSRLHDLAVNEADQVTTFTFASPVCRALTTLQHLINARPYKNRDIKVMDNRISLYRVHHMPQTLRSLIFP